MQNIQQNEEEKIPEETSKKKSAGLMPDSEMIILALFSSEQSAIPVKAVYNYIRYYFPERTEVDTWENSIRHALSRHTHLFVKVDVKMPLDSNQRKTSAIWYLTPEISEKIKEKVRSGMILIDAISTTRSKNGQPRSHTLAQIFSQCGVSLPYFLDPNPKSLLAQQCAYEDPISGAERPLRPKSNPSGKPQVAESARMENIDSNRFVRPLPPPIASASRPLPRSLQNSHPLLSSQLKSPRVVSQSPSSSKYKAVESRIVYPSIEMRMRVNAPNLPSTAHPSINPLTALKSLSKSINQSTVGFPLPTHSTVPPTIQIPKASIAPHSSMSNVDGSETALDLSMPYHRAHNPTPALFPVRVASSNHLSTEQKKKQQSRSTVIVGPVTMASNESLIDHFGSFKPPSKPPPPSILHVAAMAPSTKFIPPQIPPIEHLPTPSPTPFDSSTPPANQPSTSALNQPHLSTSSLIMGGLSFHKPPPAKKSRPSHLKPYGPVNLPGYLRALQPSPPIRPVQPTKSVPTQPEPTVTDPTHDPQTTASVPTSKPTVIVPGPVPKPAVSVPAPPKPTVSGSVPPKPTVSIRTSLPIPIRHSKPTVDTSLFSSKYFTKATHTSLPTPMAVKRKVDGGLTIPQSQYHKSSIKIPSLILNAEKRKEMLAKAAGAKSAVAHKVLADELEEKRLKEDKVLSLENLHLDELSSGIERKTIDELEKSKDAENGEIQVYDIGEETVQIAKKGKEKKKDIIWIEKEKKGRGRPKGNRVQDDKEVTFLGVQEKEKIAYECKSLSFGHAEGFKYQEEVPIVREDNQLMTAEGRDDGVRKPPPVLKTKRTDDKLRWLDELEKERKELDEEWERKKWNTEESTSPLQKNTPRLQPGQRVLNNLVPFDPFFVREPETIRIGQLRRAREDWASFLITSPPNPWEVVDTFRLHLKVNGFVKDSPYVRENMRLTFARFNPNPEIPLVLTGGINRFLHCHNYKTSTMYSLHRPHATYAIDGGWSFCGQYFVGSGTDQQAAVVAPNDNPAIHRRIHVRSPIVATRFLHDKNTIIVAMRDGTIDIHDIRLRKVITSMRGIPEITCMDVNPQDQCRAAIGCRNGRLFEIDFMETHRSSIVRSFEKFNLNGDSAFLELPYQHYEKYVDNSPITSIRFSSVNELAEFKQDILLTKEDGKKGRGDSVYRLHFVDDDGENESYKQIYSLTNQNGVAPPIMTSYTAPQGYNISCATFAHLSGVIPNTEERIFHQEYVAAATEEGVVFVFDGETGKELGGYAITNSHHIGTDLGRYVRGHSKIFSKIRNIPVKNDDDKTQGFDKKLSTRITAIDSSPDPFLGLFAVGGWGENPNLFYFRFNDFYQTFPELAEIENLDKLLDFDHFSDDDE